MRLFCLIVFCAALVLRVTAYAIEDSAQAATSPTHTQTETIR